MRLLVLVLTLAAGAATAQVRTADVVSWRASAERASPGATPRVVLDATIEPGWRLYALGSTVGVPLAVTLDPLPRAVTAGSLRQSAPQEGYDPAFEAAYPYFSESGRVVQQLRVGARAARGTHQVSGSIRYAVCDDRVCLPPATTAFRVPLVIE